MRLTTLLSERAGVLQKAEVPVPPVGKPGTKVSLRCSSLTRKIVAYRMLRLDIGSVLLRYRTEPLGHPVAIFNVSRKSKHGCA